MFLFQKVLRHGRNSPSAFMEREGSREAQAQLSIPREALLAARGTQALHKDMVDPHVSKTHANFWECPKPLQKYSLVVTDPKSGAPK